MDGLSLAVARLLVSFVASQGHHHEAVAPPIGRPAAPAYLLHAGVPERAASAFPLLDGQQGLWPDSSVPLYVNSGPQQSPRQAEARLAQVDPSATPTGIDKAIFRTCFTETCR
jgi:hypothetical protein